ncbi:MAG: translation initiation factor IF-2 [Flavobacteriales bacterium]|nr:translation initiation factor IF-2 [Flavobacteriales bacterium]
MRLSKVAKELNVGIANIVDHLASKGVEIDGRPNTKITPDAYEILKQHFIADVEQHKRSAEVAIARREEKEAIKASVAKKSQQKDEVIKAKADFSGPKMVGKIDVQSKSKSESKEEAPAKEVVETATETTTPDAKAIEAKPQKETAIKEAPKATKPKIEKEKPVAKKKEVVKAKGALSVSGPKQVGKIDVNKPIKAEKVTQIKVEKLNRPEVKKEEKPLEKKDEVLRAKSKVLSGPKLTGQVIDLAQFAKPKKKKVASSSNPSGNKDNKKKRKRINQGPAAGKPARPNQRGGGNRGANKGRKPKVAKVEPTEEEIQKKIAETLDKLTGKGKSKGAKHRRSKRDERREQDVKDQMLADEASKIVKVTEFVTVNELATMMDVQVTQIISSCMMLGIMVTMNQRLDAETLTIVADEFGYEVEFVSAEVQESIVEDEDNPEDLIARSPIVTVMGHVDHGKTSLLDYVRHANVIAGEAGGITQHIGAYEVELKSGKRITFIDTPGHEAFTAMRARGAQVTDIAIIVIAADDEIMPQTKEAISHAQAAEVPILFAINKIDKPNANPDKIKEQLAAMDLLVEDWGGKFQSHDVSAKNGQGVEDLLEKVMLEAEMLDLKANPDKSALGSIIEASLDKGKGFVTTMLVQAGTLSVGDFLLAGHYTGKVKAMFNERGHNVETAGPSAPVSILGLSGAPQAGDNFNVMTDEREAKAIALKRTQLQREQSIRTQKHLTLDEIGRRLALGDFKELNVILKGDVDGSIEALSDSLQKLSTDSIQVNIIHKAVGQISESDILLATASDAIVIGFQVRPSTSARKLAEKEQIDIRLYSIIYDAINEVKEAMEGMLSPDTKEEIVCNIEVRETFKVSKVGTIAGCYVLDGKLSRNTDVRLIRDGVVVYTGGLGSLKRFKDDVKEVTKGYECGLNIEKFNDIKIGDIIEGYEQVEVKRTL